MSFYALSPMHFCFALAITVATLIVAEGLLEFRYSMFSRQYDRWSSRLHLVFWVLLFLHLIGFAFWWAGQ